MAYISSDILSLRIMYETAFITAPSTTTPAVTYLQSATSSFRASATIVVLRRRPPLRLRGRGTRGRAPSPADGAAIARRAGSSSFVVADFPIARCLARDLPTRFARALGQGRHKRLSVVGSRRVGKAPPTRGPPRTPARCLSRPATSPAGQALWFVPRRAAHPARPPQS